jgi:two-component system sensor histidine kinase RpfC
MLSADATAEAKREASEAGADAFLAKPIEAIRLLDTIRSLTSGTGQAQAEPVASARAPAKLPAASAMDVLNRETLSHLEVLGSSAGFVAKLVGVFLADSGALLERIDKSLSSRNYAEFRSVLHAMKGSSASMGTDRLTSLCGRLGALSDAELRLQSAGLRGSISDELDAARGELERYLQEREASTG